jgi:transposase
MQVFGCARRGCGHDLPSNLDHFAAFGRGRLGSPVDIALDHSLLPYYLMFRSAAVRRRMLAECCTGATAPHKALLGILASRFGADHPLKLCPRCMAEDVDAHGVAYWHRTHQLPGIWVCPAHCEALRVLPLVWNGVDRFGLHLPDLARSEDVQWPMEARTRESLLSVAASTRHLLSLSREGPLDVERLRFTYRQALRHQGAFRGQHIDVATFSAIMQQVISPLQGVGEFAAFQADADALAARFLPLVRGRRQVLHPLRHVVLITALFPSWEAFINRYEAASGICALSQARFPSSSVAPPSGAIEPRREALLRFVQAEGWSVSRAAKAVGIATNTAQAWCASAGIASARRPKTVSPSIRQQLIAGLTAGEDKSTLANVHGVSTQTVTRTLREEVGLHMAWTHARRVAAQMNARASWLDATARLAQPAAKVLRQQLPAVYAWLYRNDRDWLRAQLARLPHAAPQKTSHVDWPSRDAELARQVLLVSGRADFGCQNGMTLAALAARVPPLKRSLNKLRYLPKTRDAIRKTLARQRQASGAAATTGADPLSPQAAQERQRDFALRPGRV